jgi:hypothetical protein
VIIQNGTIEIAGPWASNQFVIGQITLNASATITLLVPTDFASYTEWVAVSNITLSNNAFLEGGSTIGALGDLETFGANFPTNCTSCSNSADILWISNSTTTVQTITTNSTMSVADVIEKIRLRFGDQAAGSVKITVH